MFTNRLKMYFVLQLLRNCLTMNDTSFPQLFHLVQYSGPCNSVGYLGYLKRQLMMMRRRMMNRQTNRQMPGIITSKAGVINKMSALKATII